MKNLMILSLLFLANTFGSTHAHDYSEPQGSSKELSALEAKQDKTGRLSNIKDFFKKNKSLCIGLGIALTIYVILGCCELINQKPNVERSTHRAPNNPARAAAADTPRYERVAEELDPQIIEALRTTATLTSEEETRLQALREKRYESYKEAVATGGAHFEKALALALKDDSKFVKPAQCQICCEFLPGIALFNCASTIPNAVERAKVIVNDHSICATCAPKVIDSRTIACCPFCREETVWEPQTLEVDQA